MKFIPRYTVSYRGRWHDAGRGFDIDAADEMKKHGEVVEKPVPETVQESKPAASRKKSTK